MTNPPQNLHIPSRDSSRHRPASFLGSYLDSVEMDPDFMIGAAAIGHFQPLQWDPPALGDRDIALVEDEDGEAERLLLQRMPGRLGRASVEDDDGGSNVAIYDRRHSREVEVGQKRRWSKRFSETILDFGKKVKERAGSFAWRRDSVQLQVVVGGQSDLLSEEVLEGSGERSRDGDDELSFIEVPRSSERSQTQRSFVGPPRVSTEPVRMEARMEYLYPGEVPHRRSVGAGESSSAAVPDGRMSFQSFQIANQMNGQQINKEREVLAMLERGVRIAERQGAFSAARRAKLFKKAWAHRTTDGAQARASVKYREELASRKQREDDDFLTWSIEKDMTPLERVRRRVETWIRSVSVSREGSREDSGDGSGVASAVEDDAHSSPGSVVNGDADDERRQDNIAAARYAGRALQEALIAI